MCDALQPSRGSVRPFSWTSLWYRVERIIEIRRQRRALMALDERMLKDVGLSRTDAWREANRSLLDLPEDHWSPLRWR
jgi:uncharacterized protein YjiS (DUF1127 family)